MLQRLFPKDLEVVLEVSNSAQRLLGFSREHQDSHLSVELTPLGPGAEALASRANMPAAGVLVQVYLESEGACWVIPARSLGESPVEPGWLELELCGEPERLERRFGLRVDAEGLGVRALLAGEACSVLELCEVSFSVAATAEYALGSVVEAVVYDDGEALPGRVRVESRTELEAGAFRYGLLCLDGRLKFDLAAVSLAVQRARIRGHRRPG